MSITSQYEYIDEASIDGELICVICNKPLEDPRCTPCDHIFCNVCITQWIQRNNLSCPTCRQPLRIHELTQASRTVRNILGKLRVKCVLCKKMNLERSEFEYHVTNICPAVCLAADIMCPWKGSRGQLDNHMANCQYQALRPVLIPLMAERQQLKEQVIQQKMEAKKYKDKIPQLEKQIAEQQTHNQNNSRYAKEREMQQKTEIDTYQNKLRLFHEQLEREQNQHLNEIHHLKHQTKQQITQIDRYEQEIRHLQEQLKRQNNQNQISSLKEEMKQQRAAAEGYQNDTIRLRERLKQQHVEIDGHQIEMKNLKTQIHDQRNQSRNEIRQLKGIEMHYKADIDEYRNKIQRLEQQLEDQQSQTSEHQHQEDEMERVVQLQNDDLMSQTDFEPRQRQPVWNRLSNPTGTIRSNQTVHKRAKKRLRK